MTKSKGAATAAAKDGTDTGPGVMDSLTFRAELGSLSIGKNAVAIPFKASRGQASTRETPAGLSLIQADEWLVGRRVEVTVALAEDAGDDPTQKRIEFPKGKTKEWSSIADVHRGSFSSTEISGRFSFRRSEVDTEHMADFISRLALITVTTIGNAGEDTDEGEGE